jgi:hypothetical protein
VPGPLIHVGAQVKCAHVGTATPTVPNPRVLVSGQPTVTITAPWVVAGCTMPPPPGGNGPCVTAQWVTGSVRVLSNGQPLVLFDSQAICAPTGTPVLIVASQMRVIGM